MPLRQLLGIEHPIIQAPMVGVSTPALAAAVSEAGALGSIGLGASSPAQARELIAQVRALTARPVNFNLFCHRPGQADAAREAAWVEHLRPLFEELGGEPPGCCGKSTAASSTIRRCWRCCWKSARRWSASTSACPRRAGSTG